MGPPGKRRSRATVGGDISGHLSAKGTREATSLVIRATVSPGQSDGRDCPCGRFSAVGCRARLENCTRVLVQDARWGIGGTLEIGKRGGGAVSLPEESPGRRFKSAATP